MSVNQFKQLGIVDISGKVLLRKNITQQTEKVDISRLAKRMYFIRLNNDNTTITKQFVKE